MKGMSVEYFFHNLKVCDSFVQHNGLMQSVSENSVLSHAYLIIIFQMFINNSSYSACHISSNSKSGLVYNHLQPFSPIFLEIDIMSAFLRS